MTVILEPHLGGHSNKTNVDDGALSYLINKYNPKSFLDIGCGPGGMVELADDNGLYSRGIDGDYTVKRFSDSHFVVHDFTKGPAPLDRIFDLGWSVEFVEHVYEDYIPNYIQAFQACKVILLTYAPPGYGGYHHVNEQTESYWLGVMKNHGFKYDQQTSQEVRNASTLNLKKKGGRKAFVRHRGLIFINERISKN